MQLASSAFGHAYEGAAPPIAATPNNAATSNFAVTQLTYRDSCVD